MSKAETTGAERADALLRAKRAWQREFYAGLPMLSPPQYGRLLPRRWDSRVECGRQNVPMVSRMHVSSRVIERKLPRAERKVAAKWRRQVAADKKMIARHRKEARHGSKIELVGQADG